MQRKRAALFAAAGLLLGACEDMTTTPSPPSQDQGTLAPLFRSTSGVPSDPNLRRFMVLYRNDVPIDAVALTRELASKYGFRTYHEYVAGLQGFSAELSESVLLALRAHPSVAFIAQNTKGRFSGTQLNPPWGLDRIDERSRPLDSEYYYQTTASNVQVHIIDTGIRATHVDFGGRVSTTSFYDFLNAPSPQDCDGHGTAIAGIVGGATYGVAKSSQLRSVRVACDVPYQDEYVEGIEWVNTHHSDPAVALIAADFDRSFPLSAMLDTAVARATRAPYYVPYVVAAGNGPVDACTRSPAHLAEVVAVSATNEYDEKLFTSNFGSCVDIFAPGWNIVTAGRNADNETQIVGGTSYAAPFVAGAAALYLATNPSGRPSDVQYWLGNCTVGVLTLIGDYSPDCLLYSLEPVWPTITGPDEAAPFDYCLWRAEVLHGKPPYTYTWYWDDAVVSTASSYSRSMGPLSGFQNGDEVGWLELYVQDATEHEQRADGFIIRKTVPGDGC